MSAEAAKWTPVSKLKRWRKNPRKNQPVQEVARSIKELGWGSVIVARKDGTIVAGDTRLQAHAMLKRQWKGQKAGWHADAVHAVTKDVVPVRFGDWSDRQATLLALADNRLAEKAEWERLDDVLEDMSLSDAGLAGFNAKDLDSLLSPWDSDGSTNNAGSLGPKLEGLTYKVVVTCADENDQIELLENLEREGRKCQPLIS